MAETKENTETKKSPKILIIIIASLVLLIGAGAGGYFYLNSSAKNDQEKEDGKEKKAAEEHKKESEAESEEHPIPDVLYELPSPLIVDFPAGSSAKVIKLSISILIKGEEGVAVLKKNDPMLRNNLLMAISAIGAEKARTTEGKQELRALMLSEIGKVMEKMAAKNSVKDLYFTEFVMQ
jgi:flagellar protein FliL